jgi:signal transduction histidine kinase
MSVPERDRRFARDDAATPLRPDREPAAFEHGPECEALAAHLHDTTLQVLEYIARGGEFDPDTFCREVKLLAAREATALRDHLEGRGDDEASPLEATLRAIVAEARTLADHEIQLIVGPLDDPLDAGDVPELAAAVREALTNARKHANACHVTVYLEAVDGLALVTVKDDGIGADMDRLAPGLGLRRSILGRMAGAGGSARLTSRPGQGMLVTLEQPTRSATGGGR